MATRKTKSVSKKSTSASTTPSKVTTTSPASRITPRFILVVALIIALGTLAFFLARRYRGLVIAAVVNKTPITRWQLNDILARRYGKPVLDELISQELLLQEAAKQKITVNKDEITEEKKKLEENLGGAENLNLALVQYGLTLEDLERQIKLRLVQLKLSEKLFTVDITQEQAMTYFETNKETLYKDAKFEDVQGQITQSLKEAEQEQKFSQWFQELKANSKVQKYID